MDVMCFCTDTFFYFEVTDTYFIKSHPCFGAYLAAIWLYDYGINCSFHA